MLNCQVFQKQSTDRAWSIAQSQERWAQHHFQVPKPVVTWTEGWQHPKGLPPGHQIEQLLPNKRREHFKPLPLNMMKIHIMSRKKLTSNVNFVYENRKMNRKFIRKTATLAHFLEIHWWALFLSKWAAVFLKHSNLASATQTTQLFHHSLFLTPTKRTQRKALHWWRWNQPPATASRLPCTTSPWNPVWRRSHLTSIPYCYRFICFYRGTRTFSHHKYVRKYVFNMLTLPAKAIDKLFSTEPHIWSATNT